MNTTWLIALAGALLGLGAVIAVAGLVPAKPDLVDAVHRLLPTDGRAPGPAPATGRRAAVERRVLPPVAHTLRLDRYAADLRMLSISPEELAARKLGYALLGVAFPPVMTTLLLLLGLRLPVALPTVAGFVLGAVFFFLPDLSLRQDSTAARASMRAVTCVFLELVAMERLADAGATEALDRAAQIGGSAEFARIRDALLRAELAGQPAWAGLVDLAHTTQVPELGDAADIMRLAGRDGAAVYATLRARAASLRTQLLTDATTKANAASEHMVVPVSLLGLCFVALLGYPAFVRILLA